MDVALIKHLSAVFGIFSAAATAYFLHKHIGNVRKIEFLESVRRIDELRDLVQELNLENPTEEPFHCAITGAVGYADLTGLRAQELNLENPTEEPFHRAITGAADLTGLRGVMVKRMVKEHYHQLDINITRRVTKGILMPKRKGEISDSWRQHSNILSSNLQEVPWHLDDGTGRVLVVGAGDSDFELPLITSLTHLYGPHQTPVHSPFSTRSTFEAWDRALIHETENCIQVSKIISLEMIEQVLPVQTFLTVVGQVTNTEEEGLTIGRSDKWPLLITQLTIDRYIANLANFERWPERAWVGLTECCAAIYIICYISEDGIAANCAPVLHRLQRGLYMG